MPLVPHKEHAGRAPIGCRHECGCAHGQGAAQPEGYQHRPLAPGGRKEPDVLDPTRIQSGLLQVDGGSSQNDYDETQDKRRAYYIITHTLFRS